MKKNNYFCKKGGLHNNTFGQPKSKEITTNPKTVYIYNIKITTNQGKEHKKLLYLPKYNKLIYSTEESSFSLNYLDKIQCKRIEEHIAQGKTLKLNVFVMIDLFFINFYKLFFVFSKWFVCCCRCQFGSGSFILRAGTIAALSKCHHRNCSSSNEESTTLYAYNIHCYNSSHAGQPIHPEFPLIELLNLEPRGNPWKEVVKNDTYLPLSNSSILGQKFIEKYYYDNQFDNNDSNQRGLGEYI